MFPNLPNSGGNCQDAVRLVDELATTIKLLGACEGTEIKKRNYSKLEYLLLGNFFSIHMPG